MLQLAYSARCRVLWGWRFSDSRGKKQEVRCRRWQCGLLGRFQIRCWRYCSDCRCIGCCVRRGGRWERRSSVHRACTRAVCSGDGFEFCCSPSWHARPYFAAELALQRPHTPGWAACGPTACWCDCSQCCCAGSTSQTLRKGECRGHSREPPSTTVQVRWRLFLRGRRHGWQMRWCCNFEESLALTTTSKSLWPWINSNEFII